MPCLVGWLQSGWGQTELGVTGHLQRCFNLPSNPKGWNEMIQGPFQPRPAWDFILSSNLSWYLILETFPAISVFQTEAQEGDKSNMDHFGDTHFCLVPVPSIPFTPSSIQQPKPLFPRYLGCFSSCKHEPGLVSHR